jgi:DNA-binding NarL/FixJ family response regulator
MDEREVRGRHRALDGEPLPFVESPVEEPQGLGLRARRRGEPQREVAQLVGQGCRNEEIAQRLGKSVLTVKKQLCSIYEKLDVPNRGRLIAWLR